MFHKQIVAGIEFLNGALGEGWHERIDMARLDMGSGCDCVIGQLFGSFYEFQHPKEGLTRYTWDDTDALGFSCGAGYYPILTEEWEEQLYALRLP